MFLKYRNNLHVWSKQSPCKFGRIQEHSQTAKMKLFVKIFFDFQPIVSNTISEFCSLKHLKRTSDCKIIYQIEQLHLKLSEKPSQCYWTPLNGGSYELTIVCPSLCPSVCLSVCQFGGFLGDCFIVFSGFVFA